MSKNKFEYLNMALSKGFTIGILYLIYLLETMLQKLEYAMVVHVTNRLC